MSTDPLSSYLLNDEHRHAALSPESLEMMGKEAANMFLDRGVSLNEGIAKLAGAHDDINHEQVKRICEFANTAVYLAKHDQSKTAGAGSSYPQFVLADPNRIIQDLSDGARPTIVTQTDADYGRQPLRKEKFSSAAFDALVNEYVTETEEENPDHSPETGVDNIMATKSQLAGLRDNLSSTGERFDLMRKEAEVEYYDLMKRHLLDGGGFEDVMVSARSSGADEGRVGETLQPFVAQLIKEKVASPERLKAGVRNLEKVAHRVVNQEHPFVKTFAAILALDDEIEKVASSLSTVSEQLDTVNAFIKEQCRGEAR